MAYILIATILFTMSGSVSLAAEYHVFIVVYSADDTLCIRLNNYYNDARNDMAVVNRYELNDLFEKVDINNDNVAELVHKHIGSLSSHLTQQLNIYKNNSKAIDCLRAENNLSKLCDGVLIGVIPEPDVSLEKLPLQSSWARQYIDIGPYIVIDILNIDKQNYIEISINHKEFNIKGSNWKIIRKYDVNLKHHDICYILDQYYVKEREE